MPEGAGMKVFIIHQYEACEYGEYYGIHKVYLKKEDANKEADKLSKVDKNFDYMIEEQEVIDG